MFSSGDDVGAGWLSNVLWLVTPLFRVLEATIAGPTMEQSNTSKSFLVTYLIGFSRVLFQPNFPASCE
jgi:hypothetical protein